MAKDYSPERAIKDFERYRVIDGQDIILPEPPAKTAIDNWNKQPENQYFIREVFPTEAAFKQFSIKEQNRLFDKWFNYRYHGYWFFNNGNLEYITGDHWIYLNCYYGEGGDVYFIDSDRDWFYIWEKVILSDTILGMLYGCNRRDGKTQKLLSVIQNSSAWEFRSNYGMQENTIEGAEEMFMRLVTSWQHAPFFMRPLYNNPSRPKSGLEFFAPSEKGRIKMYNNAVSLETKIDFRSSDLGAYDKSRLKIIGHDEVGKAKSVNVNDRFNRVRETLKRGDTIVGKYLACSTVEDEEDEFGQSKGVDSWSIRNFKKLWERSIPVEGETTTESGLITYFKPAYRGFEGHIDKYGYSNEETAKASILKHRAMLSGDDLLSYIRKYPFTREEYFSTVDKGEDIDIQKIDDQTKWNDLNVDKPNGEIKKVKGNFYWASRFGGDVVWIPEANGRFEVVCHPPADRINKRFIRDGKPMPANRTSGVGGVDSVDAAKKQGSTRSMYAAVGMLFDNPNEAYKNCIVFTYCCRLNDPQLHHEDMAKVAIYYGIEMHFEYMKTAGVEYFKNNGFEGYLAKRPKNLLFNTRYARSTDYGTPTQDKKVRTALMEYITRYIASNCGHSEEGMGNIYFTEILNQVKGLFADKEWTKYDLAVAFMMALGIYYSDRKKIRTYDATAVSGIMDFKKY
jgi:hypothetical protein